MTRYRCRTCGTSVYNQSNLEEYDFRDAPLAIFDRDSEGKIQRIEELIPKTHIFCAHENHKLLRDNNGVVKFLGHAGMSEKIEEISRTK